MKNVSIWSAVVLVVLATGAFAQKKMSSGSTQKAVEALENKWLESQKTNNVSLLEPLLADKFINTGADGKVTDRAGSISQAKSIKWSSAEYQDLKVTVFGNTAIAAGTFIGKGTDDKGKNLDENERFTDTWTKMPSGKWQCIASQDTSIKM